MELGMACHVERTENNHEYRRQQRRFEEMGSTVHLSNFGTQVDSVVDGSGQCEPRLSTRVKHRQECMKQMRWFSSRRVLEGIDAKQIFYFVLRQSERHCAADLRNITLVWK